MDKEIVEKAVADTEKKIKKAQDNREHFHNLALVAGLDGNYAKAADHRKIAQGYENDAFYWRGWRNAYLSMGLAQVVEEEIDSEPTCP